MGRSQLSVRILHENCDPSLADDRSLPYTAYLVKYRLDGQLNHDIVICNKKTDIFDYYWDRYREDLISFEQTEGRVNPKLWGSQQQSKKKK